jgi:clan AA aspartic protease (TIGR02281 family)
MKRSTYWVLIVGSCIASAVARQPYTIPLVACVLWIGSVGALITAIFERAKATGRRPWLWLALSLIPFMAFVLGFFPDAEAPRPPKLIKTIGWSFASVVSFMIAVIVAYPLMTPLGDQLAQGVSNDTASLPKKIDDITTLTAERLDGLQMTYVYELNGELSDSAQARLTNRVCNMPALRDPMAKGVTYRYEYWRAGTLLGGFDIASCPASVPTTTASVAHAHSSVDVVLDGDRALAPLQVGSQSIYATVDTGCTDMTVNENLANKLLALGEATELGMGDVSLADGSVKSMRHIRITAVTIGGHSVHGVTAMVVPDGTMMLLGYNVLSQVSGKFAINTAQSTLDFD